MSESSNKSETESSNKYLVGPGLGIIIMGAAYLIWWIAFIEYALMDPRWTHNIAYAIIILNVGVAWYHKSPISRIIAFIQSFMLPVTGSGSFNTVICSIICAIIFAIWGIVVLLEKNRDKLFLDDNLSIRGKNWLNLHTMILAWILIAHMGLMFFIVRLPMEANLYSYSPRAGYLMNLPPESHEFATWVFDIGLFILCFVLIKEQYKMGYNIKNKPWPKTSFYVVILIMIASLIALWIQSVTIGQDWVTQVYG